MNWCKYLSPARWPYAPTRIGIEFRFYHFTADASLRGGHQRHLTLSANGDDEIKKMYPTDIRQTRIRTTLDANRAHRLSLSVIFHGFGFNCFRVCTRVCVAHCVCIGMIRLHRTAHARTHAFPQKGSCPEDNIRPSKYTHRSWSRYTFSVCFRHEKWIYRPNMVGLLSARPPTSTWVKFQSLNHKKNGNTIGWFKCFHTINAFGARDRIDKFCVGNFSHSPKRTVHQQHEKMKKEKTRWRWKAACEAEESNGENIHFRAER